MGLRDRAKADTEKITSDLTGWAIVMTFTNPSASKTATINGLSRSIRLGVDTEGNMVNSKTASVTFSEKFLLDAEYPVRNSKGEVDLIGHKVDVKDSTGNVKHYVVQQTFPDETIGLIPCLLEDYEQD